MQEDTPAVQKRVSDPLGTDVGSCEPPGVGAEKQSLAFCMSSNYMLHLLRQLSSPLNYVLFPDSLSKHT